MAVFSVTGGGLVFAGGAALGEAFVSALVAGAESVSGAVFAPGSAATGAAAFVAVDALGAGLADVLVLTVFATVADGDVLPLLLATAWVAAAESVLLGFSVLLAGAVAAVVALFASVTARWLRFVAEGFFVSAAGDSCWVLPALVGLATAEGVVDEAEVVLTADDGERLLFRMFSVSTTAVRRDCRPAFAVALTRCPLADMASAGSSAL